MGSSAILAIAIQILLAYGSDWLDNVTAEKKAEVERKVKDAVPRLSRWIPESKTDEWAWQIVNASWDMIIAAAKARLGALALASIPEDHPESLMAAIACVDDVKAA